MSQPHEMTVLVVDDNEVKRYSVVRILRQAGFRILEATTGEEALVMAAQRPDLMVLDVKLPGMSGFEVCQHIKADPEMAGIKVLHVSATFIDSDHRVEGLAHGADGYLVQPVDPGELVETVRALLRLREAEEASRRTAREWRATFDALANGILLVDDRGTILRCNRSMAEIVGKPFHAIIGAAYCDVLPGPLAAALEAPNRPASPAPREVRHEDRQYLVAQNPVLDGQEQATGSVYVFTDITERNRTEEALRRSTTLVQAISDTTGDVIFAKDRDGRVTFANPATLSLIGKPLEIVLGRTDAELLADPEVARTIMANDRRVMERGVPEDLEEMVPLPDGTPRLWFSRKMPYRDPDGRVIGLLGVSRDITERKQMEEELAAARERLEVSLTAGDVAVWIWDIPNDRVIADRNLRAFFALPQEGPDLPMAAFLGAIHPDDRDHVARIIDAALANGDRPYETEYRVTGADGAQRWILARGTVERDAEGQATRMPGVALDVTQRHMAQAALKESEERFRTLADNMSQFAWMADPSGSIFWYNQRWFDYTGTTLEEMRDSGWTKLYHPDHVDRVVTRFQRACSTGEPWEDTFPLRGRDGEYRWFLSRAVPVRDAFGTIARWFGTNTDVTEQRLMADTLRRQAQELAAADRAKDDFLAMLAHELRNPLSAIANAGALIDMKTAGQDAIRKPVDILNRQVKHTARLVDDLLDVSRITRGKLDLRRELQDLAEVARRAAETARPQMEAARHHFSVAIPSVPLWVDGDAARLEQVIGNLLNNAAKYTDPGGRIALSVHAEDGGAVIQVRDNGQGISPEMLPRIFDMFAQEDRSLVRAKGGMGIGLTLVQKLVQMHDGTIDVRSDGPGLGSEFLIRLPLLQTDTSEPGETAGRAAGAGLRILLVEDNVDAATALADILEVWGHQVTAVHNGPAALDAAPGQAPDLILLDIGLPGMNGYDVARVLRDEKALAHSRIVALTGYGQETDRDRAYAAGFDGHLVKPVDIGTLKQLLEDLELDTRPRP